MHLNLAMVFMSTSGVLGRYISLPPPLTIWGRCLVACLLLYIYCKYKGITIKMNLAHDGGALGIAAVLLVGHWITYFYALHLSNVAIGMLSLFTYPVFTSFLEPLLLRTKFDYSHIGLGILAFLGIYLLAPEFSLENNYFLGILFGLLSSLLYALRNILLKKKVGRYHGSVLMFYQLFFGALILLPLPFMLDTSAASQHWPAIIALALITTAIGHTMFIMGLKHFSVTTTSIISSIQPIYGIVLGIIFLNEIPEWNTVLGGSIILATVVIESVRSYRVNQH